MIFIHIYTLYLCHFEIFVMLLGIFFRIYRLQGQNQKLRLRQANFRTKSTKARQRRVVQMSTREDMQESKLINEHQKRYAEIQNHPITPDEQNEDQKTTEKRFTLISRPGRLGNRPGGS